MPNLMTRRLMQNVEENAVKSFHADVREVVDSDLPLMIDWPSFKDDASRIERIELCALRQIRDAFSEICRDELGKQAVKDSIKAVTLVNAETSADNGLDLKDGLLTVKSTCVNGEYFGTYEIRDALLATL